MKNWIICPNCNSKQLGEVEETFPWLTFIHECEKCNYIIMESEWVNIEG